MWLMFWILCSVGSKWIMYIQCTFEHILHYIQRRRIHNPVKHLRWSFLRKSFSWVQLCPWYVWNFIGRHTNNVLLPNLESFMRPGRQILGKFIQIHLPWKHEAGDNLVFLFLFFFVVAVVVVVVFWFLVFLWGDTSVFLRM